MTKKDRWSKLINVTKKDYELGERGRPTWCAVARAIKRRYPKEDVKVLVTYARIGNDMYDLPEKAQTQIKIYDGLVNGEQKPIRFRMWQCLTQKV